MTPDTLAAQGGIALEGTVISEAGAYLLRLPMVSWQVHSILFSGGKQLLFQLVNLAVQLLDMSCLGDTLVHLRPAGVRLCCLPQSLELEVAKVLVAAC